MIPTRLALKILADILTASADRLDEGFRAGRGLVRSPATARFRADAKRLVAMADSHRSVEPVECSPAVLGYLCCYLRGSLHAIPLMIEYFERRQEGPTAALKAVSPGERATVCLIALGVIR